jgi:hypothetical protein
MKSQTVLNCSLDLLMMPGTTASQQREVVSSANRKARQGRDPQDVFEADSLLANLANLVRTDFRNMHVM